MKALVFPGQGSQYQGMSLEFYKDYKIARDVFSEVSDCLGRDFSKLIFEGKADELNQTKNTQVAIMIASVSAFRVVIEEFGAGFYEQSLFAGHSLGEYSALMAVKAFDLATCAKLLDARGQAMQDAQPLGVGAMAAVIGLNQQGVEKLLNSFKALAITSGEVEIANDNSAKQWVFSGLSGDIDKFMDFVKNYGTEQQIRRLKVVKLPVSAPFHCSLMQKAKDKMTNVLNTAKIDDINYPVIANVNAKPELLASDIRSNLIDQITSRVLWRDTIEYFIENNISYQIEIGPSKVLTNLMKRTLTDKDNRTDNRNIEIISISKPSDFSSLPKDLLAKL